MEREDVYQQNLVLTNLENKDKAHKNLIKFLRKLPHV